MSKTDIETFDPIANLKAQAEMYDLRAKGFDDDIRRHTKNRDDAMENARIARQAIEILQAHTEIPQPKETGDE